MDFESISLATRTQCHVISPHQRIRWPMACLNACRTGTHIATARPYQSIHRCSAAKILPPFATIEDTLLHEHQLHVKCERHSRTSRLATLTNGFSDMKTKTDNKLNTKTCRHTQIPSTTTRAISNRNNPGTHQRPRSLPSLGVCNRLPRGLLATTRGQSTSPL